MFRIFETSIEWFDNTKQLILSSDMTFNLAMVMGWERCHNPEYDFDDDKERTTIHYAGGKIYCIPKNYKEFTNIMTTFLYQVGQLDRGSMPAKDYYQGPAKWYFSEGKGVVSAAAYPKGAKVDNRTEIFANCLHSNLQTLS